MISVALTIAGSDPSGGAGIQADLKTFHQMGVYGMSVITLLTVQNTQRVDRVEPLDPELVMRQLDAVLEDIPPQATKTGALGSLGIIEALAQKVSGFSFPLVVDPVMTSKHGKLLLDPKALDAFKRRLLPYAYLVTPNIHEAAVLSGQTLEDEESIKEAARVIAGFGPKAVLIKGGHRPKKATDLLYFENQFYTYSEARIETSRTHGTGCTFSAAITAELAKGRGLMEAVKVAKKFVTCAIRTAPCLGHGIGPVNHQARV
ncbi:MAG: bifunctional hydroxymethylpyrimidine kinase/phosphomethylpyrimidine kinase [Candidatus Omnitrophica bacterium]|nr:bifunctional hydroxymethylpyrimidine kinase/phosphomethylpyrimidine kinase [Candidatus Omnitrophota bacterium]